LWSFYALSVVAGEAKQLQGCGFPGGDGCQLLQAADGAAAAASGAAGAVGLMAFLHDVYFINGNRSKPR
jgi:hypothetical protein